jgi:hypothetical protein
MVLQGEILSFLGGGFDLPSNPAQKVKKKYEDELYSLIEHRIMGWNLEVSMSVLSNKQHVIFHRNLFLLFIMIFF